MNQYLKIFEETYSEDRSFRVILYVHRQSGEMFASAINQLTLVPVRKCLKLKRKMHLLLPVKYGILSKITIEDEETMYANT